MHQSITVAWVQGEIVGDVIGAYSDFDFLQKVLLGLKTPPYIQKGWV